MFAINFGYVLLMLAPSTSTMLIPQHSLLLSTGRGHILPSSSSAWTALIVEIWYKSTLKKLEDIVK